MDKIQFALANDSRMASARRRASGRWRKEDECMTRAIGVQQRIFDDRCEIVAGQAAKLKVRTQWSNTLALCHMTGECYRWQSYSCVSWLDVLLSRHPRTSVL